MLSGLNRRHLLKKIFASKECDTGKESENSNSYPIIASVAVSVVETHLFPIFLFDVPLVAYASEHDYREELEKLNMNCCNFYLELFL